MNSFHPPDSHAIPITTVEDLKHDHFTLGHSVEALVLIVEGSA